MNTTPLGSAANQNAASAENDLISWRFGPSLNRLGRLDQFLQSGMSLLGLRHAARQPDEIETSLHDVLGASSPSNDMPGLPSLDNAPLLESSTLRTPPSTV